MQRRYFVLGALASMALVGAERARAAEDSGIEQLLAELEQDPSITEKAWAFRDHSLSRGVGLGRASTRAISPRAMDMITRLEVSSPAVYTKLYTRPIWPKGESGVTIGIGYDLRFANKAILQRDWAGLVSADDLQTLSRVIRLRSTAARDALPSVQSVAIPYDAAMKQFVAFVPYPTAQTEDTLPNCGDLSADSFGALVSLIYNRGTDMNKNDPRRGEMVDIREMMRTRNFSAIPERIRHMKRIWTSPDARGLVIRREVEARLFESGLASA